MARIDLDALVHNFSEVGRLVGGRVRVLAMVKSDAYGHGAVLCAEALARAGCTTFGVATADEAGALARVLRDAPAGGEPPRLLLLGGILPGEAGAAVAAGAEVATQEISVVRALGERAVAGGTEARVHVKIDTGMHRLGVEPAKAVEFVREASAIAGVRVVAICSHFAQAETVTGGVTAGQLEKLLGADAALVAAGFRLERHLANSAAVLSRPEAHLDMVRPGIMLYGVSPDATLRGIADLRPVMTLAACIMRVADVEPGEGIGYAHTYHTKARTRVATIRLGYADGYPRTLGNKGIAEVGGRRVPIVGRICMDHAMLDVSGIDDVEVGDFATMWGADPGVEEIAGLAGTIGYELLARVGPRVRRIGVSGRER